MRDDLELIDMVFPWEQRRPAQHLSQNASRAPEIDCIAVMLPCQHHLRGAVVSRDDVAGHLVVLLARQPKVADLEVAVVVDKKVLGFQVSVDNACRMDVFQSTLGESVFYWRLGDVTNVPESDR